MGKSILIATVVKGWHRKRLLPSNRQFCILPSSTFEFHSSEESLICGLLILLCGLSVTDNRRHVVVTQEPSSNLAVAVVSNCASGAYVCLLIIIIFFLQTRVFFCDTCTCVISDVANGDTSYPAFGSRLLELVFHPGPIHPAFQYLQ